MSEPFEETEVGTLVESYGLASQKIAQAANSGSNKRFLEAERRRQETKDSLIAKLKEMQDQLAAKDAALKLCVEALSGLVDEFGTSIAQYHKIGPDFIQKDGTELFQVCVLLDREQLIEAGRSALASAEKAGGGNV